MEETFYKRGRMGVVMDKTFYKPVVVLHSDMPFTPTDEKYRFLV